MSKIWAIFVKEVRGYVQSPIAWIVTTGFMILSGTMFYLGVSSYPDTIASAQESGALEVVQQNQINYFLITPFVDDMGMILLFLVPILTMRLFSEEKRMKTEELLLTSPLTVNQIVAAKYLAGLFFASILIISSLTFMFIIGYFTRFDIGATASSYAGLFLFVASLVSIGAFTSSLTENQIVASVSCLIIELLFATMGAASESISEMSLARIVGYLSIQAHMQNLFDGVLVTSDIVYFVSFCFLFLFLTNRSVESSRWR